ncbi:hypothetical protein [Candidatus Thiodictyon syntrophicum]|jgi:hypothetical protein|uniref:Uncharacterized protein n=1 Tax=Candidatus Thiodictyon syntrophicum TaxID=1166950 RepID=A0A2K8U772_9GAMM|nr:hypothetical protein [Candidatus Thiodictyon syntrophicum]AUB81458.1 hypothetical protein THSYN_11165 [Candidatus Thiodictyon syntrophicum]
MSGRLSPLSPSAPLRADPVFGGAYRIADTITELGIPGAYRVRLYHRATGRLLRETWSDPATGAYAFERIAWRDQGYFVIGFDHGAEPVNAAIADLITPEPMP